MTTKTSTATPTADVPLRGTDFFELDSQWSESRFDVADKGQVPGLGARVSSCYENNSGSPVLELRLANRFKQLRFSAGQANVSQGTDQTLTVAVLANGQQADIRRIPFNTVQKFDVPVGGANAVELRFFLDPQNPKCGAKSAQAAFFDGVLT